MVVGGGLTANMAPEPDLKLQIYGGLGSGISMAGKAKVPLRRPSPAYLLTGATFVFSQRPKWLMDVALLLEFQGRVGVGIWPRLRFEAWKRNRIQVSAGAGVPCFVAPFSLVGVSALARVEFRTGQHLHVFVEPTFSGFVAGSDLMRQQSLIKMDMTLGLRMSLPGVLP